MQFLLGSISKDLTKDKQREIFLNGTVYDFSVDHCSLGYLYDELTLPYNASEEERVCKR